MLPAQQNVLRVIPLASNRAMKLVEEFHYSRRRVGAKFCFGLLDDDHLSGCCVFSVPASYTLCNGVCGKSYRKQVIELSRLVVTTQQKNAASFLIGSSLRLLAEKGDWIIVSYADCNSHVGHVGYVYQATNWIYTGQGSSEPKWRHPETGEVISFTRRHIDTKAERYGLTWRDLVKDEQVGKHRYVTFAGSKLFKRCARNALNYPALPYPKGETHRHEAVKQLRDRMLF